MPHILGKFLHLLVVVIAVTALTYIMVERMPADIAAEIAGHNATPEERMAIRERLGLNEPAMTRYGKWVTGVMKGELGESLASRQPVSEAIRSHLPVTLELIVLAQLFALLLALPIGIVTAWRPGSLLDRAIGTVAFGLASLPAYAVAIGLVFAFALRLKWLPATGYTPFAEGMAANIRGFLLPAGSIALVEWVVLMRVLRSDLIATLSQDFILLARCKGLPPWRILLTHALRPSCFTFVTILGMQTASLVGGALIIELIFSLPGIGRLLVTAIFAQDYPVVQGCVLLIAVGYVAINFLVDVMYGLLDPRVRRGIKHG
ncbi:MAG: peptide/nickel transport system permease [Geobacteraceae bacterium]|nr:MAG: peptide/nickel transport system permease [Geobacteraceae bacterium]